MNKIRELRHKYNMKQAELADMINVSDAALSGYETGKYEADIDTYVKIAKIFHSSLVSSTKSPRRNPGAFSVKYQCFQGLSAPCAPVARMHKGA